MMISQPDGSFRRSLLMRSGYVGLVALAFVVLSAAGCSDAAPVAIAPSTSTPPASSLTTTPPSAAERRLTAADRALLDEIRGLRADWRAGRIDIDWPPPGDDSAGDFAAISDLEEVFRYMEEAVFSPEVTAYLHSGAGTAMDLRAEIAAWSEVTSLRFVSSEEALAQLREDLGENADDILPSLDPANPLPSSIEIWVEDEAAPSVVGERLQGRLEVDEVRWAADSKLSFERLLAVLKSHARPTGS
jgi:hypothetical protein